MEILDLLLRKDLVGKIVIGAAIGIVLKHAWRIFVIAQLREFLTNGVWRIRSRDLSPYKAFRLRILRAFLLAIDSFIKDKCLLRASAITFYTILSIVPVFAMLFGVARGFGMERMLEERLLDEFPQNREAIVHIISFSDALLKNTRTGAVAGVGVAMLFYLVIKVLGNIESSLNDIWRVTQSRSFARKFSDYLSLMLICPILLILSGSTTLFISAYLKDISMKYAGGTYLMILFFTFLKLSAYAIPWGLFTFIYVFMPNTRVRMKSGLVAGVMAGSVYQILQWVYIKFQIGVSSYNAVYGTFAAMPLFLIWLQLSWLIVLFGAEFCHAYQNAESFEFSPDFDEISSSAKTVILLGCASAIALRFKKMQSPPNAGDLSAEFDLPLSVVEDSLCVLSKARVISPLPVQGGKPPSYVPLIPLEDLSFSAALGRISRSGKNEIPQFRNGLLSRIADLVKESSAAIEKGDFNRKLSDL